MVLYYSYSGQIADRKEIKRQRTEMLAKKIAEVSFRGQKTAEEEINILFVDDDEKDCELYEAIILSCCSHANFLRAENPRDAIKYISKRKLHIAFLDYSVLQGVDLIKEIRVHSPNCYIIGHSNYDEHNNKLLEKGANVKSTKDGRAATVKAILKSSPFPQLVMQP